MKFSNLFFRVSGAFMVLGSIAAVIGHLLKPQPPVSNNGIAVFISESLHSDTLLIIGVPVVLLCMAAIFIKQSEKLSLWGWAGYPLMFIGLLVVDLIQPVIRLAAYPYVLADVNGEKEIFQAVTTIYDQEPFGFLNFLLLLSLIGPLWSAVAFWKAKTYPGWLPLMLALLVPVFIIAPLFGFFNFPAYLYVVFTLFGIRLITDTLKKQSAPSHSPDL
ncbi:hypothetical protein DRW41_04890 [Neobacillus piezotolerans]|uniref:DUF4386 domain-containing protein n=1 Tax=Neobacillus piezotolerans TaxID=2259171 RepID=A0A3D8GWS2_9BACI|nr:hypothetical protein [Neobacillus piezotolerans]RDU38895.1 hypothetical protein DRW41_04890 [Neobacillus piezotolerans]